MRITDRVVVITGASSGIGRATAHEFARRGAALVLVARGPEALEATVRECVALGAPALAVPTDTTDPEAVESVARLAVERFGHLDVWVNCAAVHLAGTFDQIPLAEVRRLLDVNVMGYVHGARAALPWLVRQGEGVLVNVSSLLGIVTLPYGYPYAMSKYAVQALTGSLRQELRLAGHRGVHACAVLPPPVDTPLFQHAGNYTGRRVLAMPPVFAPERIAAAVVGVVRRPRREVAVGWVGKALVPATRIAPGLTERVMARHIDLTHLSKEDGLPATPGNLYRPDIGPGSVHGGWAGRGRALHAAAALTAGAVTVGAVLTAGVLATTARARRR